MELTSKQEVGLKLAIERHRSGEKCTVISGYAGTGKSTLVRFIIEALDVEESKVCYTAFTGKAAEVLRKKGNKNVCTLHKLLYDHFPRPAGGFYRKPKAKIDYDVVVVDEISMAPKTLIDLLFRHKCYIICLGDPFQLPPIDKEENNHLLDKPHIFLDEVMRQAKESEIIRLTMDIREGNPIKPTQGNEVIVLDKKDLNTGMLLWADQILVATNVARQKINTQMRQLLGFEGNPKDGDKVICLRNYWDVVDNDDNPLINGTIGFLKNNYTQTLSVPYFINGGCKFDVIRGGITTEINTRFEDLIMDKKLILEGTKSLPQKTEWRLMKSDSFSWMIPKEFTYGYAVTVHKFQGSSAKNILVIEENFPFSKEEHQKWLYTACTRAENKLVIVKK